MKVVLATGQNRATVFSEIGYLLHIKDGDGIGKQNVIELLGSNYVSNPAKSIPLNLHISDA